MKNEQIIKETEDILSKKAYELFNKVIDTAHPSLLANYREDVSIYAPAFLIKYYKKWFEHSYMFTESLDGLIFRGYNIRLHFDNEIVLAHKDYAIYKTENLINKITV